jgi:hypothetical protein
VISLANESDMDRTPYGSRKMKPSVRRQSTALSGQPELQNKIGRPGLCVIGWQLPRRLLRVLVAEVREITARRETTPIRMNVWK